MTIREEIEKLETHRHPYQPGYQTTDEFLRKSDILWILDEHLGELVADDKAGKLIPVRLGDLLEKNIRPGDCIAVYVRRKNESSS